MYINATVESCKTVRLNYMWGDITTVIVILFYYRIPDVSEGT